MKYRTMFLGIAALAMLVYFAGRSITAITAVAPSFETIEGLPTIVIDAGHGGYDGGAVSRDGTVVEKDVNLAIAQDLYDLFVINGFDVVLTRDEDISLHTDNSVSNKKKKSQDLARRMEIAKSYDNAILLSIHQNNFVSAKSWGAQIFYGPQNEESEAMAKILQRRFVEMLQPENARLYKACPDSVYLIHDAPMPALLIECGFLSNPQEMEKLNDPEYQKQVAFVIFTSVMEYYDIIYEDSDPQAAWLAQRGLLEAEE